MSFDNSIIKIKSYDDLLNYICKDKCDTYSKSNEPNTITIYHIHIGAKTYILQDITDTTYVKHNHELTSFLKTLFLEPLKQFSPEFISQLSQYPEINIRNILILIDSSYSRSPDLEGFVEMSEHTDMNSQHLKNEQLVHHSRDRLDTSDTSDTFTTLYTSFEILQLPIDVNEEDIIKLVTIINDTDNHIDNSNSYSVLINIMDCTSRVLLEYYSTQMSDTNTSTSKLFITRPDCLIIDTLPKYKPIITLNMSMCMNRTIPGKLFVRWMNYNDDKHIIRELEQVLDLDICDSYRITHTFLTENYKYNIGLENLISIVKIWSRLTYTNIQEISKFPEYDEGKRILSIQFSTISFPNFIRYWKKYSNFRKFILDNVDYYYRDALKVYLDIFCDKYVGCQLTIIEALQIEASEILKNLMNYCKSDVNYIIDTIKDIAGSDGSGGSGDSGDDSGGGNGDSSGSTHKLLERKHIMDYLKFNNINL